MSAAALVEFTGVVKQYQALRPLRLAALTIVPGAIVIWFVRHYIAKGFAMGRV